MNSGLFLRFVGAIVAALLAWTTPAAATVTFSSYSIAGTGTGSFTTSYDDATSNYALTAFNLSVGLHTYNLAAVGTQLTSPHSLVIGELGCGITIVCFNTANPDFAFALDPALQTQIQPISYVSLASGVDGVSTGSLTITNLTTNVPESATWVMMLWGFGGIGIAVRRNREVADAQFA